MDSGNDPVVKPVTMATRPDSGRPVPVARNVDPVHGRFSAVSVLAPPELGHPGAVELAAAGQVVVRRARWADTRPPAIVNHPPATRSPLGSVASAITSDEPPLIPAPSADQLVPFHRAMLSAGTPPAVVKWPAATTSPFGNVARAHTGPSMPVPRGNHVVPFQCATRSAGRPPAVVNVPPATKSPFGRLVKAWTM